jgi:hypothetical protein
LNTKKLYLEVLVGFLEKALFFAHKNGDHNVFVFRECEWRI